MHDSLGVLLGLRNAQHVYWAERSLIPWDLHGCVCGRGCHHFIYSGQHPYAREYQMDCVGWSGLCLHCWYGIPRLDQFTALTSRQ